MTQARTAFGNVTRAALLGATVAWAANAEAQSLPALSTDADTSEITLGGRVALTVSVEHASGARVAFPDSLDLGPFEIVRVEEGGPEQLREHEWSWARYTLTAFELGELEIPAFEVAVVSAAGDATTLDTSPWGVVVTSVGLDESGDIRDVKAPLSIPLSLLVVLGWVVAALLALALLYALYRRHRRQPPADAIDIAAPLRRPYETAYDRLRELEASGMLERGELKEYYIAVSEIIRAYVEAQYRVPALEMASYEVLQGLDDIGVDLETRRDFEGFFAEADLVKFAKFRPDMARARQIVPRARKLVDRTKVGRPTPATAAVATSDGGQPVATVGGSVVDAGPQPVATGGAGAIEADGQPQTPDADGPS